MVVKPCVECGLNYNARGAHKYCSPQCRDTARKRYLIRYYADPVVRARRREIDRRYRARPESQELKRQSSLRYYQRTRTARLAYGREYRQRPEVIERRKHRKGKRSCFARILSSLNVRRNV